MHRTQRRRFENSLLSGLFRIMFCSRLIQQSVHLSLSVRSERVWRRRFRIRVPAAKLRFTHACKGWNQSWLVLIGRLSRDAARANLRSRRAPGLGRNHLSCKREYAWSLAISAWYRLTSDASHSFSCLHYYYSQKSLTHDIGSASALPIVIFKRLCRKFFLRWILLTPEGSTLS